MKKYFLPFSFIIIAICIASCTKQNDLSAIPIKEPGLSYISFIEDTIAIKLTVTNARKESIGNIFTTTIEGKLADNVLRQNSLVIRFTGDSARAYTNIEIFASYTDSAGMTYANSITDTTNKMVITKIERKKYGIVEGDFTIRVSNFTKTKTLLLKEGKFSTVFSE